MARELRTLIKNQRNFYRDSYRYGCNFLLALLIIILGLSLAIIYISVERRQPDFYASSNAGNLMPLTPMSTPNYSHAALIK